MVVERLELCVRTRVPVFLGGGPGLYAVCCWHKPVGLFWECPCLWGVYVCGSLQCLWRGPGPSLLGDRLWAGSVPAFPH